MNDGLERNDGKRSVSSLFACVVASVVLTVRCTAAQRPVGDAKLLTSCRGKERPRA